MADTDITLKMILEHMQAMRSDLLQRIDDLGKTLSIRIDGLQGQIDGNQRSLQAQINGLERQIATLQVGVENIDKRLDEIKIEELPKRVRALEKAIA